MVSVNLEPPCAAGTRCQLAPRAFERPAPPPARLPLPISAPFHSSRLVARRVAPRWPQSRQSSQWPHVIAGRTSLSWRSRRGRSSRRANETCARREARRCKWENSGREYKLCACSNVPRALCLVCSHICRHVAPITPRDLMEVIMVIIFIIMVGQLLPVIQLLIQLFPLLISAFPLLNSALSRPTVTARFQALLRAFLKNS